MKIKKGIGSDVLAFLDGQHLEATPVNYHFAYAYLQQTSPTLVNEVTEYITGRMRIRQRDVNEILRVHNTEQEENTVEVSEEESSILATISQRDKAITNFVEAAAELMKETQTTAVDLATSLKQENSSINPDTDGAQLQAVIDRIIEKSREAEEQLLEAGAKIDRLQMDLHEARNTALIDELTGLPNRRAARQLMERLDQDQLRYSIAILDIDHFKRVNDTFGHPIGDRVITHVGKTLAESLKPDMVARWGGEEYVVITSSAHNLKQRLESACNEVRTKQLRVRETDKQLGEITVSGGLAHSKGQSEDALNRADKMLYKAKQNGRNRICFDDGLAASSSKHEPAKVSNSAAMVSEAKLAAA